MVSISMEQNPVVKDLGDFAKKEILMILGYLSKKRIHKGRPMILVMNSKNVVVKKKNEERKLIDDLEQEPPVNE